MTTGFRLRNESVSTVRSGTEFDLTKSKRITRLELPGGEVNSIYQDPSGEYFSHTFTPQMDEIGRLNQDQVSKMVSFMDADGTISSDALGDIFPEEDVHEAFVGIPGELADRLQELADERGLDFNDFVVECLERVTYTKLN